MALFAVLLKRHRLAAALSQEALAERAGLSARAISDLERGVHRAPYPDTVRLLADALSARGSARSELIAAATHARTSESAPAEPSPPDAGHGRLPHPVTPLLGRSQEVAAVAELLRRPEVRLVTLTGAGGVGKTRLAIEVAARLAKTLPDGVTYVALATIRDPAQVLPTIARAFGLQAGGTRPSAEMLTAHLHDRALLLLADNVEQVLGAAPLLLDLLATCPRLKLLVTSRAALRVEGEYEIVVPPLPVPPAHPSATVEELARVPSIELFVERAAARRATFDFTARSAPAVVEICRRLDGLPLAIELAAARIGVLPANEIVDRLDDRFHLLTNGTQGAPPRQQTLRATLDWSYELLSEPERALFRRLSVFVGGWTLEAAEAVGSSELDVRRSTLDGYRSSSNFEPRTSNSTLDVLAGLVDKSLVVAEPTHPGGARYRFLETVRAYAAEHLAHATAEEADAQRCHAQYFRALAERAEPELIGPGQSAWLRRLEPDYSNVRAALAWARARGEWDEGLRLAGALCIFWMFANHLREGHDFLATFLTQARAPAPVRLKALWTAGYLAFHLGEQGTEQSPSPWARGLALAREIGPPGEIARFLAGVGSEAVVRGDSDRACALLEEALTLARQQGNAWIEHAATMWLGLLHWCTGEFEEARYRLEEALALSRIVADARHTANTLITLADVVLLQGDAAQAAALAQESLIERGALGDAWSVGITLVIMARVAVAYSQYERAARLLGAADGLRTSIGAAFELPGRWRTDARCARDATRAALNAATFHAIWTEGQTMSMEDATAYAQSVDPPAPAADRAPTEGPASLLTRREREVVTLIARGLTNPQIATALIISERTVDTHAEHIRSKLDVRSRAEIAAWATRHNLAEFPTA